MSFAVGIGAGIAIGLGVGIAVGRKSTMDSIAASGEDRGVTLQDASGDKINLNEFLSIAVASAEKKARPRLVAALILGVVMLILGVAVYWLKLKGGL